MDMRSRFEADFGDFFDSAPPSSDPAKNRRDSERAWNYFNGILESMPEGVVRAAGRPAFLAGARVAAEYIKAASRSSIGFKNKSGRLRRSIRATPGTDKYPNSALVRVGGKRARQAHLIEYGHDIVNRYGRRTLGQYGITGTRATLVRLQARTGRRVKARPFVRVGLARSVNATVAEVAKVMAGEDESVIREVRKLARSGFRTERAPRRRGR